MEKELNQEQLQELAKCIKALQRMQKKVDAIMCNIDECEDAPLDCAWWTIKETIDYLNTAIDVYQSENM